MRLGYRLGGGNVRKEEIDERELERLRQTLRRVAVAAKPERLLPLEIAHHNAEDVALPDCELVDADDRRRERRGLRELRPHVELVHLLDRMPIETEIGGDLFDRGAATLLPDVEREPFRVVRVRRQPVQSFLPHAATGATRHAPHRDLEIDAQVATGQIAHAPHAVIVPGAVDGAATPADSFFARRVSGMTRAAASGPTARVKRLGTKPGKRYASRSSCRETEVRMPRTSTRPGRARNPRFPLRFRVLRRQMASVLPTRFPEEP